jgi:histidine kinase
LSKLENYIVTNELVSTGYYILHAVKEKGTGKEFLLKNFLRLNPQRIAYLRNGMQLAKELHLDLILEPVDFFEQGLQASILYEYFDAVSLRSFLQQKKKLNAGEFIELAKKLTELFAGFHSRGWIIKNISPENILINPEQLVCKVADLRKATRIFKKEQTDIYENADLQELHYISPEQTGRMGQVTDHRSDLYSLGVIFYEMLTGRLPFEFAEAVELIHAHLALPVTEPITIDAAVPKVLSNIVMKLVSKSPEERYQSYEGLLYDIEHAQQYFDSAEQLKLASKDRITKIVPTANMIGREEELEIIENAYKAARAGKKQGVYISGYSGVGKTRIVQEFYRNKIAHKVPMVASKFDTLQRTTPYSALLGAMKELVKKLLREEDEQLAYWKKRILDYVKENAAIIIEVIPETEAMLGQQPAVNPLPPEESQKRFQQTFISFIAAFTTEEQSLILFLDDLQWADIASIRLIELTLLDDSVKNFLFIGAYRDNEVDPTHPLSISLRKQESWINLHDIKILPLQKADTGKLIVQTLHDPINREAAFIDTVFNKTDGNTFFTIQLLTVLFEENILFRNEEGEWDWNEKLLHERNISDNVVDFLEQKIGNLNPQTQSLLKIASCLGDVFDLKTLALLANKKTNTVAGELSDAVNLGYLISIDENLDAFFRTVSDIEENELAGFSNTRLRFSHDRIRQAALAQLNEHELTQLNLKAARIKISTLAEDEMEQELFYIANHLIAAEKLIEEQDEMMQLANFSYRAGVKARNSSAYDSAINYFDAAKRHLGFEKNYNQAYDVHLQQAECRYLTGKYKEAEQDLDLLYNSCQSKIDKLNTLFTKVYLYNIQDKKLEAIEAGRTGYALYNIYMPHKKATIMFLLLKDVLMAKLKLPEKKIDHLLERPLMKDPEQIRLQEFLLAMSPTIYQFDQNLFAWNFMKMFFASLKQGNNGISSFCYIGYGMLVSQLFGKYRTGKKLADVSLQLNNQLGYTALKWKVRLSYYNFVHHWTEPVRPEIDNILEVENGAYANGDPIFAGYAIFIYHQKKFALGFHLKELQQSFENYLKVVEQRHDVETHHFLESYYYAIRCLRGLENNIAEMGDGFNAPKQLQKSISSSSFTVVADTLIAYMNTLFMFGHIQDAFEQYQQAVKFKYMDFIQQRYEFAEFNFYAALICAAAYEQKISSKLNSLKQIKLHLKKLKMWKEHCAANFEPQYLIASAEMNRVTGNGQQASALYEQAIQSAEQHHFINYKALANELAGRFQFKSGNQIMSKTYLDNSRKAYMQWGAVAKVKQIEDEFSQLLGASIAEEQSAQDTNAGIVVGMDLNLILQANRAVKSEKDIDSLVAQLMKAIIQYSGADNGYLLVKNRSDLVVKANYTTTDGVKTLAEYADNEMMPMSIVKYVIRLKEPLILNHPAQIPEYSNTRYFEKSKPKSLICYPILKQDEIFGVLYLENYLHEGVFDEKKINMLNLISAQVAVSLDNAFLYQHLESRVLERTEMLEAEKGKTEEMLENILPKAAIEELKRTGKTTAQKFDNITVLIADIKGFTTISESLTPEELIGKIDFYFRSFDDIMMKYGLEKIKTIGDAYMAVGGLDGKAEEGAVNMIAAAMEMQQCMKDKNINTNADEKLEMRVGINTGTVIAGVVGIKKFQYDIWGDAVNIAARMEQQSEPGRINVSKETYAIAKGKVLFTYRGKIEAKNKGLMDMYFVESIKKSIGAVHENT